jgi:RNA polymerase sigma factor (sigma-70 family)
VSTPKGTLSPRAPGRSSASEFSVVYEANLVAISAFFARRCTEPQTVADLTSETFVEALSSLHTFDPQRGTPRGWLIAIARAVYARYYAGVVDGQAAVHRLAGVVALGEDAIEDLTERIDAQRPGRRLLQRAARLPELERTAIELVDLAGLTPKEAARALDVSPGALRVRLFRARAQLRKEGSDERI